jgi:hypothetical protein
MKLHPNYLKALKDYYKDISYIGTIEMIKKTRLYGAGSSKYTIQSLPDDSVWLTDLNLKKFGDDAFDIWESLCDEELAAYADAIGESFTELGMWISSTKAKLYLKNWHIKDWWEIKNMEKLEKIEQDFEKSIGEKYTGIIYNHIIDFKSHTKDLKDVESVLNYLESKKDFDSLLKRKEIKIHYEDKSSYELNEIFMKSIKERDGIHYSLDISIHYCELTDNNNQNIEIITLIKDYTTDNEPGCLDIVGIWGGYGSLMEHTLQKDVKFLNPFNGKWETFLLKYDTGGYASDCYYNYTHHISDDKFDFSKDFPEQDKLNKALKLHLENIKKYGKK